MENAHYSIVLNWGKKALQIYENEKNKLPSEIHLTIGRIHIGIALALLLSSDETNSSSDLVSLDSTSPSVSPSDVKSVRTKPTASNDLIKSIFSHFHSALLFYSSQSFSCAPSEDDVRYPN